MQNEIRKLAFTQMNDISINYCYDNITMYLYRAKLQCKLRHHIYFGLILENWDNWSTPNYFICYMIWSKWEKSIIVVVFTMISITKLQFIAWCCNLQNPWFWAIKPTNVWQWLFLSHNQPLCTQTKQVKTCNYIFGSFW